MACFRQLPNLRGLFINLRFETLQFDDVNIRDERTSSEQIKSGFRLGRWVLLTLAFFFAVLGRINLFVGRGDPPQASYRVLGACGLVATSSVMFVTVRRWVKWLLGYLVYFALKATIAFLLGFTPSVPSIVRPRPIFLELLLLRWLAAALFVRYLTHAPRKLE